jgi:Methyltransferase domain
MGIRTSIKDAVNRCLAPFNASFDSMTADRSELCRLEGLQRKGHFEKPVFPVLEQFEHCDPALVLRAVSETESQFAKMVATGQNGFVLDNSYFSSPDAEVLYGLTTYYKPKRIVEVGSGNSTRIFRSAIVNNSLETRLTSIDPNPRCEVVGIVDQIMCQKIEDLRHWDLFRSLCANDILFIDSSHEIRCGNDVISLFLTVLPLLANGVIIHIHDIFLPYEYPETWIVKDRWQWSEQYLVQALLAGSTQYQVLWPAYYLQRSHSSFTEKFNNLGDSTGKSLWLRKGAT